MSAQFGTWYGFGVYMFTQLDTWYGLGVYISAQFDTWYGLWVLCLHSLVLGMA